MSNLHPNESIFVSQQEKSALLGQKGWVFWMTGLSGAGKSTLAAAIEQQLHTEGRLTTVLDGDNIRSGLNSNLDFSEESRIENNRRVAEVARLFAQTGVITFVTFISPLESMRASAKSIIGAHQFSEVYIGASLEVCEARDVKGLYKKARAGEIGSFTGVNAPFEIPTAPDLVLDSGKENIAKLVSLFHDFIQSKISIPRG